MEFAAELKRIAEGIPYQKANARNEQQTIEGLIRPFIIALGYDLGNPLEAPAQYTCGDGSRVDFAILYEGKPVIIFECKPAFHNRLIDDSGQLRRYFQAAKPLVGVLTNGIQYQFFGDLDSDGSMDSEPFLEINLDGLDDEDFEDAESPVINALSVLTKSGFNPDSVVDAATALKYKRGIRKFLDLQFNGNELDRDFVELLARQVYTRRLGSVVRSNLTQLAKDVIDELKADLEKSGLTDPEHTTTAEEVEGYYIVKNILWNIIDGNRVVMRDRDSYCTIRIDDDESQGKRVCLLRFNNLNRKRIGLLDAGPEEQISIISVGEINNYADRIRQRVLQIRQNEE